MKRLYGAILGDLAGQPYEFKYKGDFSEFNIYDDRSHITDDTLMTLATAKALLEDNDFERCYKEVGLKYDSEFFGKRFREWLRTPLGTRSDSFGNGCLMRISPIMHSFIESDLSRAKSLVVKSCITSHCHEDSIITSLGLCHLYFYGDLLSNGHKSFVPYKFTEFKVDALSTYEFCRQVITNSTDLHETIKAVVSAGGDTDTNASIVGEAINHIHGGITNEDVKYVESKLDDYLLDILRRFNDR